MPALTKRAKSHIRLQLVRNLSIATITWRLRIDTGEKATKSQVANYLHKLGWGPDITVFTPWRIGYAPQDIKCYRQQRQRLISVGRFRRA